MLPAARRSAVDALRVAQQQLHVLVVAAPEPLRARFRGRSTRTMVAAAARLRIDDRRHVESRATADVLRSLARRARELRAEARRLERTIEETVRAWRPDVLHEFGVGPLVAAVVLCAWSHPGRVRSEAAFANLAGAAPVPASSGMTVRHRLTASATDSSTAPCTRSCCADCATTRAPAPTPSAGVPRARPTARSRGA